MSQALLAANERRATAPLVWACAAFTGGVLLHFDRVPAWAAVAALALVVIYTNRIAFFSPRGRRWQRWR